MGVQAGWFGCARWGGGCVSLAPRWAAVSGMGDRCGRGASRPFQERCTRSVALCPVAAWTWSPCMRTEGWLACAAWRSLSLQQQDEGCDVYRQLGKDKNTAGWGALMAATLGREGLEALPVNATLLVPQQAAVYRYLAILGFTKVNSAINAMKLIPGLQPMMTSLVLYHITIEGDEAASWEPTVESRPTALELRTIDLVYTNGTEVGGVVGCVWWVGKREGEIACWLMAVSVARGGGRGDGRRGMASAV